MSGSAADLGPDGSGGPHVFVGDIDHPDLDEADRHHLSRVLRLRHGDSLTVCDGAGRWRSAHFGDALDGLGEIVDVPRADPAIAVAFALVKGERPELVVQKLTELGVDQIIPFVAARSVVRWDASRAAANLVRLRKVAREASMQCRRCHLPDVEPLTSFAEVAGRPGVALADRGGDPLHRGVRILMIGPEGGWTPDERDGRVAIRLPGHVLRAETAAIAGAASLAGLRAGLFESVADSS